MIIKNGIAAALLFAAVLGNASPVSAQYKVGDRVQIGNDTGTIIEIGPPVFNGGHEIKVHLDRFGDAFPNTGVMYDPSVVKVKPAGAAAPPGQGAGGGGLPNQGNGTPAPANTAVQTAKNFQKGQRVFVGAMNEWGTVVGPGVGPNVVKVHLDRFGAAPSTVNFDPIASKLQAAGTPGAPADPGPAKGAASDTHQAPGPGDQANQVPDNAPPTAANFKKIIEANILQPGWGDTISYTWQSFTVSGPMSYDIKYAGHLNQETDLGGPGKTVQAYKVHAKYVMTTHYQDPHADDQAVTKEGDYMIYKDTNGHWVPEDVNVQVGPTQYIHKQ